MKRANVIYRYNVKKRNGEILFTGSSREVAEWLGTSVNSVCTRSLKRPRNGDIYIDRYTVDKETGENVDVEKIPKQTKCWDCENANRLQCSWFDVPAKPVDGWNAVRRDIKWRDYGRGMDIVQESYIVVDCPNFKQDERAAEYYLSLEQERKQKDEERIRLSKENCAQENEGRGAALKACRLAAGISRAKVGRIVHKSESTIYAYEVGFARYDTEMMEEALPNIRDYLKEVNEDV